MRVAGIVLGFTLVACAPAPTNDAITDGDTGSTTEASTSVATSSVSITTSGSAGSGTSGEDADTGATAPATTTTGEDGSFSVGWGLDRFNPIADVLPVFVGPQGLNMFSLPLRGSGFPVPPQPVDFDDPDLPVLTMWVDVEGYEPHLAEVSDYVVPFSPDVDSPADYEYVAVWLTIPDDVAPEDLVALPAQLHAELDTADGQHLEADYDVAVVIGDQR